MLLFTSERSFSPLNAPFNNCHAQPSPRKRLLDVAPQCQPHSPRASDNPSSGLRDNKGSCFRFAPVKDSWSLQITFVGVSNLLIAFDKDYLKT
jgi:hypothetical protein